MPFIIRFFLFILFFYLIAHLFFRYLIPWLMRRWVKKLEKRQQENQKQYYRSQSKSKEGEVHVDKVPEQDKNDNSHKATDDGDYVDYEEL